MIRYLETEEKGRCLDLWREAFPEDSTEFCDYYFKEKMKDNRVLVREENGEIVSMIHRNPYRIYMRGNEAVCDYIVGVSTLVSERHKAHAGDAAGYAGRAHAVYLSDACKGIPVPPV